MSRARVALMLCALVMGSATLSVQAAETLLSVGGEVPQPLKLTADEFARLPRKSLQVKDAKGEPIEYEGVPLVEVLKAAGVKFGEDLRGPALASYLVVEAADGYRAVFALPELDPASTDQVVLLADRRNGKPLDAKEGPLRVLVPGEKRHSRWVRQVIALKLGVPDSFPGAVHLRIADSMK